MIFFLVNFFLLNKFFIKYFGIFLIDIFLLEIKILYLLLLVILDIFNFWNWDILNLVLMFLWKIWSLVWYGKLYCLIGFFKLFK